MTARVAGTQGTGLRHARGHRLVQAASPDGRDFIPEATEDSEGKEVRRLALVLSAHSDCCVGGRRGSGGLARTSAQQSGQALMSARRKRVHPRGI